MAIFGPSKKSALGRLRASEWRDEEERNGLIAQVRAQSMKPQDFVFLLVHQDPACRQTGVALVQAYTGAGMLEALIDEAEGKPEPVRKALLRLMSTVPLKQAIASIDKLIEPGSSPGAARVGWQLALDLPKQHRRKYVELGMKSANAALRSQAVLRYLEDLPPGASLTAQILELVRDPDERVRAQVIALLESSSAPQVVDVMIDRLLHDGPQIRARALAYLSRAAKSSDPRMQERILGMLGQGDDSARRAAVELLLSTRPPVQVLTMILEYSRGLLGWLRNRILETLRTFGDVLLDPVAGLLEHPNDDIRTQALVLAQSLKERRLVPVIVRLLKDPDWWIRITAADCLGSIADEAAVPALVEALQDPECKWAALDALAKIGSPRSLKPISTMLGDPKPEVRSEAVTALGNFADARILPLLRHSAENDTSQAVRTRAAEVLRLLAAKLDVPIPGGELSTAARQAKDIDKPLDAVLTHARHAGASDVHLTVGEPPWFRLGGEMRRMTEYPAVTRERAEGWLVEILDARRKKQLDELGEVDLCHVIPEVGRYRANVYTQKKGLCGSFRVIPNLPPTFDDLAMPPTLREILDFHQGIITVAGPAGCGKSTTLAALVNLINETKPHHVISLEDPIEFVHPAKSALVDQREAGRHTESFHRALRAALREDPDVIVVGEMRDPETTRMALTAAETGHLVLATLHTTSAVQTIDRLIAAFPPDEQPQVRMALSDSLKLVICQSLVPRADGNGRVAVFEILKGTLSVANLIRENKTFQLPSLMQIGRSIGMRTVDDALAELLDRALITPETAHARAEKKELFEARVGLSSGAEARSP